MSDELQREILTIPEDRLINYCNTLNEVLCEANNIAHNIADNLAENRDFAISIVSGFKSWPKWKG